MKNILAVAGIVLGILFLVANPRAGLVQDFRVLGRIDNSKALQSGTVSDRNPAIFQFQEGAESSFVIMFDSPKKIRDVRLYFVKGKEPKDVLLETSEDLFVWKKVSEPVRPVVLPDSQNVLVAGFPSIGRFSSFLRFTFTKDSSSSLGLAGLQIEQETMQPLKSVRLEKVKVDEQSVTLRILTDTEAVGTIRYGEEINQLKDGPLQVGYSTDQLVTIDGLLKGTEYWFIGIAQDALGTVKYSVPIQVRTAGIPLPVIQRVDVTDLRHDSLVLDVKCNIPVSLVLEYGYSASGLSVKNFPSYLASRKIRLTGLKPETTLHYKITVTDSRKNVASTRMSDVTTEPLNILRLAKISGSFNFAGENLNPIHASNEQGRFFDGDFAYMTGSLMSGDIMEKSQELEIEFPSPVNLARLDLVWWGLAYSPSTSVSISKDRRNWDHVVQGLAPDKDIVLSQAGRHPHLVTRIKLNKDLRYIKCEFPRNEIQRRFPQYRNIRLLEVYAIPGETATGTINAVELKERD